MMWDFLFIPVEHRVSTVVQRWHNLLVALCLTTTRTYCRSCLDRLQVTMPGILAYMYLSLLFCVTECYCQIDAKISEREIRPIQFSHWLCINQSFFSFDVTSRSIYHPRGHAHLSALVPSESKNWPFLLLFNSADETKK